MKKIALFLILVLSAFLVIGASCARQTSGTNPYVNNPPVNNQGNPNDQTDKSSSTVSDKPQEKAATSSPATEKSATTSPDTNKKQPAKPATKYVSINNFSFSPAEISVKVGDTVVWTNNDSVSHTIAAKDGSFSSPVLSNGSTFKFTFTKAGYTDYICSIHPSMTGKVEVEN